MNDVTIQIGGEAGFGIMSAGTMLAKACIRAGFHILATNEYPSLIRGGQNTVTIRIADHPFSSLTKAVHIIVALNTEAITKGKESMVAPGCILFDPKNTDGKTLEQKEGIPLLPVALTDIAVSLGKDMIVRNTIAIGAVMAILGMDFSYLEQVITDQFAKKGQAVVDENVQAARAGYDTVIVQNQTALRLGLPAEKKTLFVMNASEAVGLGALESGMKFAAIYPMTPINALITFFADNAKKFGIVYKQPEDEIAAINMAIGASIAGARSMVASSGGGFALMVEGVSLAGITETPLVIDLGMRPGPATGMPTWTEQAELWMAIHAGHGEFSRIVLAPGDAAEAYSQTIEAFELADRFHIPVFILTDKYLNESQWCVDENDLSKRSPFSRGKICLDKVPEGSVFARYALATDDGVSVRSVPGVKNGHFLANSYEHDEVGLTTEDAKMRTDMVNKRMKKHAAILQAMQHPTVIGDDHPDITFVSWGSTKGAIISAMEMLSAKGKTAKLIHFPWVYPLSKEVVTGLLTGQTRLICVENNATGQFAQVIREETGMTISETFLQYNGRQWHPEDIVEKCL